ncbi:MULTISPECIES: TRAP transporter small permease subunit [Inquilinus]|uniref:TRAP transporter small permease protein n=1 Tax=Inquilinus ginsengisoli TaxID=363840 RepID=A0ABU1JRJ4_9PROT|nr:TRAP transporter small permease subunit [Inquilinus ginsengisoli]MDR6291217.1 TRAP-type mannitol/chloroaromatic compound transport system permease small subunit [Inquilinus ginsengisoli]
MGALLGASRVIDAVNGWIGRSVSWLVLVAVLVSTGNAILRKSFSISSNAWLELQWYLFSAVFLLAAGYTLLKGEHVKVDILYARWPRRAQLWIEVFGTVVFLLPFCIITILLSWPVMVDKYVSGEISGNANGLILWPVWALIPAGFLLLGLQGLSELVKRIAILSGRIPDIVEAHGHEADPL